MKETMMPMFIKDGAEARRIVPEDIQVVKVEGHYTSVYFADAKKPWVMAYPFATLMALEPFAHMTTINRGVAVNTTHVQRIKKGMLVMDNGLEFAVGRYHKDDVLKMFVIYG